MSYHSDLLENLARFLADNGAGVYRETGIYQPSERGIVFGQIPETPDEVIALRLQDPTTTELSPTAGADLTASRVQIAWRTVGNPLNGYKLFDRLRSLINGKRLGLGGNIVRGRYRSFGEIGPDSNHRVLFSSNWTLAGFEPRA